MDNHKTCLGVEQGLACPYPSEWSNAPLISLRLEDEDLTARSDNLEKSTVLVRKIVKKIVAASALLALLTLALVSCTITGNDDTNKTDNTVGMESHNFTQSSITIKKGESITLDNQDANVHI